MNAKRSFVSPVNKNKTPNSLSNGRELIGDSFYSIESHNATNGSPLEFLIYA